MREIQFPHEQRDFHFMFSHKLSVLVWAFGLMVFVLTGFVYAQMPGLLGRTLPEMYGKFRVEKVGTYAEYSLVFKQSQNEEKLKFSMVGEEATPQGKLYWYEMRSYNRNSAETNIVKMLISGDPKEKGNIKRMIIKHNQEKALELPAEVLSVGDVQGLAKGEVQKGLKDTTEVKKEQKVKELAKEKVKTAAGVFECVHLRYEESPKDTVNAWTSEQVPIFGLVKFESKDKRLELTSYGKDAVSAITEKPEQLRLPKDVQGSGK